MADGVETAVWNTEVGDEMEVGNRRKMGVANGLPEMVGGHGN